MKYFTVYSDTNKLLIMQLHGAAGVSRRPSSAGWWLQMTAHKLYSLLVGRYSHVDQCWHNFLCEIMNSMIYSECKLCCLFFVCLFFYLFLCKLSLRDNDIIPHSSSVKLIPPKTSLAIIDTKVFSWSCLFSCCHFQKLIVSNPARLLSTTSWQPWKTWFPKVASVSFLGSAPTDVFQERTSEVVLKFVIQSCSKYYTSPLTL